MKRGEPSERNIRSRPGIGATGHIVQDKELLFKHLVIDQPTLILILHGAKTLRSPHGSCDLCAGHAVAVTGGVFDVINRVPALGPYEAIWLTWDAALIAAHEAAAGMTATPRCHAPAHPLRAMHPAFAGAISAAIEGIAENGVPDMAARHRMQELLAWLQDAGVRFPAPGVRKLADAARALLGSNPGKAWNAAEVARQLAMSPATLRRRLAAEGVSLTELLTDVRMSFALALLQSTERPITRIATESGYESASRFAIRFRKRFGFAPTEIRGHRRSSPLAPRDAPLRGPAAFPLRTDQG